MNHFQNETFKILEILKQSPHGMSITEIARAIQKNKHSVGRYLNVLQVSGHVDMRMFGKAKVFSAASRIPQDLLLNYSREFVLLIDKDNRILHVNNFFLDLINAPREAVLGKNLHFISGMASCSQTILSSIQSGLKSGIPEYEISMENDIQKTYSLRLISIVFNNGTKGTAISMEDISERKNAVLLEHKYNALLNLVSDCPHSGILISKNEHVIFANEAINKIFGFNCQGIPLFYLMEHVVPENRDYFKKLLSGNQEGMKKNSTITFGVEGISGIRKTISGRFVIVDGTGEISFFLLLIDISE